MKLKRPKKRGFTLIELIAVIAILAILGAVLVPRISGYQNKAHKANLQTSSKILVHAIQAYNSDARARINPAAAVQGQVIIDDDIVGTAIPIVNLANGSGGSTINVTDPIYIQLSGLTVQELVAVSKGNFIYVTTALATANVTVDTAKDLIAN